MSNLDDARAALRARQGSGARFDATSAPARSLELARLGTAYFARKLNELSDLDLAQPSARAGWSRARVVASVALQAREIAQAIEEANGLDSDERADTDDAALDLAETLPPRALRHLAAHADVHLNVVWRDLDDAGWAGNVMLHAGATDTRDTPRLRALAVWGGALALGNGARLRDLPQELRDALQHHGRKDEPMTNLFPSPQWPTVPVKGETAAYPVHRIFCVGRNYAAHAAEMGTEVDREAPFYFTKSALMAQPTDTTVAYPPGTENFHYEMELVIAIGAPVFRADLETAAKAIYGYCCGLDMTRRDLQLAARDKQRPWDLGKDVEQSAVFAPISKADAVGEIGPQRIHLEVNGEVKQDAHLSDMIWKVDEIVSDLSKFYHLKPGDLIMTGTPAGVGAVVPGDVITGGIDGLDPVKLTIGDAE